MKLSDGWYNVDVTFDDPINGYTGEAGGFENRNYLLVSTKVLKKDHNWDNSSYSNNEGEKYLYYGQYILEDGIPVAVAPDAFRLYDGFKDRLTELTLPETIKTIGDGAFYECTSLKKIIIGPNVNYIGKCAFYGCKKLKEINIPESLEEIESYAFYNCSSLNYLKIPNTISLIGGSAFKNTPWIDSQKDKFIVAGNGVLIGTNLSDYNQVDIPGNVKVISGTFQDVDTLNNVTIPYGVTHIIDSAFSNTSISSLVIPDTVTVIGDNICMDCHELKEVKFSSNLKKIGEMAFYNCYNLEKAEFPDGLESINGAAFENCHCLDDVVIPKSVTNLHDSFDHSGYLYNSPGDFEIVGDSILIKYQGCDTDIVIPETIKTIAPFAFDENSEIKKITLPSTIIKIDDFTFCGCHSLETISIPDTVTEIGDSVFASTSIKDIVIPGSVKKIGNYAFVNCASLETVTIKNGVELLVMKHFVILI